ncbi:MAG: HAD-IA family hydrolase [Gammaproteobacteria bacterium]
MVRSIVFDVGWVFVHLDARPILECLAIGDADRPALQALVESVHLDDHETGRVHGHALLERLAALARRPVSLEEVRAKWLDMFVLQPPMVDLAHRLSERYRVHLLSNIGDLHWAHLSREYGLHRIGHGALPSFLAGVMKPDAGIFAEAERRFGLEPRATVFIDDRLENVDAARARGWQGILHSGHASTVNALRALGVEGMLASTR